MQTVYYFNPQNKFSSDERCDINELLNQELDDSCSIAKACVAPGIKTQLHCVQHTSERYVILQGKGEVLINHETPRSVTCLDTVFIPPGVAQQIINTGDEELQFLCICTPRFKQENYRNLEDEIEK